MKKKLISLNNIFSVAFFATATVLSSLEIYSGRIILKAFIYLIVSFIISEILSDNDH